MTFQKQVHLPKRRVILEHCAMKIKYSKRKAEAVFYIISGCVCSSCCAGKTKVACLQEQRLGRRTLNNERGEVMTGRLCGM
jgi:hypothetical protein